VARAADAPFYSQISGAKIVCKSQFVKSWTLSMILTMIINYDFTHKLLSRSSMI